MDTSTDQPWTGRRVYMGPAGPGDEPVAMIATGSELTFSAHPDPMVRALHAPITRYGPEDMPLEEAQAYVALCERRLEQSRALLEELPAKIEAQSALVEDNRAKLAAAHAAVARVVHDDLAWLDARGFQWKPSGTIMMRNATIAPGVWIQHRQCELRDTAEYRRHAVLEARSKSSTSAETLAVQERDNLRQRLVDEKSLRDRLESRLYDLRRHVRACERDAAELEAMT